MSGERALPGSAGAVERRRTSPRCRPGPAVPGSLSEQPRESRACPCCSCVPDHLDGAGRGPEGAGRRPRPRPCRALPRDRRSQASIVTTCCDRLQVPRISPSTRSAPGHTRDVQSSARSIRPRDEELPLFSVEQEVGVAARQQAGRRVGCLGGAHGPASSASSHSSPSGERTGTSNPSSEAKAAAPALREIPAQREKLSAVVGPKTWR